ncbi:MAG TPA: hypothetical protein VLZ74_02985 [Methylocella sp.]|nr:hypothetical protein [Methylocella sp.]
MKRSRVLIAAVALAALAASEPAAAFRGRAHHRGTFAGRSIGYHHHGSHRGHWRYGGTALTGGKDGVGGGAGSQPLPGSGATPHYSYGYHCRNYGFGYNCPYYELPDWNGTTEVKNPGG